MKTIAIDFDGVIHKYSKGWQDGSIYDGPTVNCFHCINTLLKQGYSVFIFSTRSARQIKKWLKNYSNQLMYYTPDDYQDRFWPMTEWDKKWIEDEQNPNKLQYKIQIIPFWKKFWNEKNIIGITKRKLPAHVYIDDRAVVFDNNWVQIVTDIFREI